MRRYLLDTGVLAAYLRGRSGAVKLVEPWAQAGETATSIVVYGEVVEYLQRLSDPEYARYLGLLRGLLYTRYTGEQRSCARGHREDCAALWAK